MIAAAVVTQIDLEAARAEAQHLCQLAELRLAPLAALVVEECLRGEDGEVGLAVQAQHECSVGRDAELRCRQRAFEAVRVHGRLSRRAPPGAVGADVQNHRPA